MRFGFLIHLETKKEQRKAGQEQEDLNHDKANVKTAFNVRGFLRLSILLQLGLP